ncbi:MAG TPA: ComEC/Rec2 family competence protein, partial [Phycisphaerales bacterium]|nr:ComEC/Rec2 family competence protein [Phycisphaerales bacterium]
LATPQRAPASMGAFAAPGRQVATRLEVRVWRAQDAAGWQPCVGRVTAYVAGAGRLPGAGTPVRLTGLLSTPAAPLNPGEPDGRLWAAQSGRAGNLSVPSPRLVEPVHWEPGPAAALRGAAARVLARVRDGARACLARATDRPEDGPPGGPPVDLRDAGGAGPMLGALLLGVQDDALAELSASMTRLGIVHLLVISGFHLVVLAGLVRVVVRALGDRGRLEPIVLAGVIGVYLLALPAQAPVWRAAVMVLAFVVAEAAGRRYDRVGVLGWIGVGLLIWRPLDLWSLGFQLSLGIVAALLLWADPVHERLVGSARTRLVPRAAPRTTLGVSLRVLGDRSARAATAAVLCWLVATPVVMYHTGQFSPLAVPATLLLAPVVALLLCAGYPLIVVAALWPDAASTLAAPIAWLAEATGAVVGWIDGLPGSGLVMPPISAPLAAAAVAALVAALVALRPLPGATALAGLGLWLGIETALGPALSWRGLARLDALAVGDGSCLILRVRDGPLREHMLMWDCGSLHPGAGRRLVPRAARALGAWHVPTVVITHDDLDHYSALAEAAPVLGVRRVLVPPQFLESVATRPDGPAARLLGRLRALGVEVVGVAAGDRVQLGPATLEFLWPPASFRPAADNDASLVARVRVPTPAGARHVLLTGDIQHAAIRSLLAERRDALGAHVLEVPHHGAFSDAAAELAALVGPRVLIASTGPRRATDTRWGRLREHPGWLTTHVHGACGARIGRDGSVAPWRFRAAPKGDAAPGPGSR